MLRAVGCGKCSLYRDVGRGSKLCSWQHWGLCDLTEGASGSWGLGVHQRKQPVRTPAGAGGVALGWRGLEPQRPQGAWCLTLQRREAFAQSSGVASGSSPPSVLFGDVLWRSGTSGMQSHRVMPAQALTVPCNLRCPRFSLTAAMLQTLQLMNNSTVNRENISQWPRYLTLYMCLLTTRLYL